MSSELPQPPSSEMPQNSELPKSSELPKEESKHKVLFLTEEDAAIPSKVRISGIKG